MSNHENWEAFRGECLDYMQKVKDGVINKWLDDIKFSEPVAYNMDLGSRVITIYSRVPGVLIGRAGVNINKLKELLNEEFHSGEWLVNFEEVRGGFIIPIKKPEKSNHYYASGMSLIEGRWQSCGWTIEAESFLEAAKIADADKKFRIHSLSDNVMY